MKPSLIDKIISQSEFFENGVVLSSEKNQIFKSNCELKHSSGFDHNISIHNSNLHPQFDPIILDPTKEFFNGQIVKTNRIDFNELKDSDVKFHIGLVKPSNASKGKRLWILAGNNIFVLFDSKGGEYKYFNANSANSRNRNFTIRENESIHKYTIKTNDKKNMKETTFFYSDVYSGKKSQSYEWFFKSICVTGGAPPVIKETLGFYRSIFVNMQFLTIFASICNKNTTTVDAIDAWIACAHDYLPSILPILIQNFIRTYQNISEEDFFNNCFAAKAVIRLLCYDPEITKHTAGTSTLNDILVTFEKRKVNSLSKYVVFILLNEFYRKNKSMENLVNVMYYLLVNIINRSSDAYSKDRIQKVVNKYSVFPSEYKLHHETVATFRHISVLVEYIVLERENFLRIAREYDFSSFVSDQLINYFASGFHVLPEPEEMTTTVTNTAATTMTHTSVPNTEEGLSQINNEHSAEANQRERSPKRVETEDTKDSQEEQQRNNEEAKNKNNVTMHIPRQEQRLPTPPFMLNNDTSPAPNASTNNAATSEIADMKEKSLKTGTNELMPAPPLENAFRKPAKNKYAAELSSQESLNDPKRKKDDDSPKKKINHIPNYTVDETEDSNTEYSFESQTSEPIIIPPKPKKLNEYPKGFESDPESDSNPLPPQRNSPLKLPTKEQLDKVVGQKPSIMQDPQYHTLSSGSQDNSSDSEENQKRNIDLISPRDPLNMNEQQAPLAFDQSTTKQSTSNNQTYPDTSKPSTSDSRPIQLVELKEPPQIQTSTTQSTTYTATTGTATTTNATNITNSNTIPITPPTPKEFDNVNTESPKAPPQEQNERPELPTEEKQNEVNSPQKAEDESSQNPSKTESKTESRSIRSAADNPNYDSIDTNTESPNMYTYPDSSEHFDNE